VWIDAVIHDNCVKACVNIEWYLLMLIITMTDLKLGRRLFT